jgi:hypothetical protein
MREDMNTVVHEVYRHGRGLMVRPGRPVRNAEMLPSRESMRSRYHVAWGRSMKEQSESFVALRRYLDKQVGRPWADIYSELRSRFDARSWRNQRVLEKVRWWVTSTGLFLENGQVLHGSAYGPPLPPAGLYVHPATGLLTSSRADYRKPDYYATSHGGTAP